MSGCRAIAVTAHIEISAAAFADFDSGIILVPLFFVVARVTGVLVAEPQAVGPTIKHRNSADRDGRLGINRRLVLFSNG